VRQNGLMGTTFKVGGHVSWNSEAVNYKGYAHHASEEDPQHGIKSGKTGHIGG